MADKEILVPPSFHENLDHVSFSPRDLAFELLVTRSILRSLDIDQILYVVLSGATSGEGLGFNRALFFLADDGQRYLRTAMAVGPIYRQEAHRIWEDMRQKSLTLEALITVYDGMKNDPQAHRLSRRLRHLNISLDSLKELSSRAESLSGHGRTRIEPIVARCLLDKTPLQSRSLELACEAPGDKEPFSFRNWWMVPLLTPDRIVGALVVDDAFGEREVSAGVQHLLLALADLSTIAVEKNKLFEEMRALARVDGLTGLANRRSYEKSLERLMTQARQTGRSVSLIVVDIDHFKRFNDEHGHLAGDDALRFVANTLRMNSRKTDIVCRYGGEEFVILLPDSTYEQGLSIAEKLVEAVRTKSVEEKIGPITISAGVAHSSKGESEGITLFERADQALYRAKNAGRNRVKGTPPGSPGYS